MKWFSSAMFWYILAVIAIIVFAAFVIKSYCKKLSQGCCGSGSDEKVVKIRPIDKNKSNYPFQTVLTVDAMVCKNCAQKIENALNVLDGTWASADVSKGTVTVLTKSEPDEEKLRTAVNSLGAYTVMKIEKSV
ncbi:MAG: heavy-metal-associated domain-containing protein [Acutalibacteraceae bacterium]